MHEVAGHVLTTVLSPRLKVPSTLEVYAVYFQSYKLVQNPSPFIYLGSRRLPVVHAARLPTVKTKSLLSSASPAHLAFVLFRYGNTTRHNGCHNAEEGCPLWRR